MYFLLCVLDIKRCVFYVCVILHNGRLAVCSYHSRTRNLEKCRAVLIPKKDRLQLDCKHTKRL